MPPVFDRQTLQRAEFRLRRHFVRPSWRTLARPKLPAAGPAGPRAPGSSRQPRQAIFFNSRHTQPDRFTDYTAVCHGPMGGAAPSSGGCPRSSAAGAGRLCHKDHSASRNKTPRFGKISTEYAPTRPMRFPVGPRVQRCRSSLLLPAQRRHVGAGRGLARNCHGPIERDCRFRGGERDRARSLVKRPFEILSGLSTCTRRQRPLHGWVVALRCHRPARRDGPRPQIRRAPCCDA